MPNTSLFFYSRHLLLLGMVLYCATFLVAEDLVILKNGQPAITNNGAGIPEYASPTTLAQDALSGLPDIYVRSYSFRGTLTSMETLIANGLNTADQGNTLQELKVLGSPLCYPSPFRPAYGTELRFTMNRDAEVQIRIYDMAATQVYQGNFPKGGVFSPSPSDRLGVLGINSLKISQALLGSDMSAGVYFVLIMSDGKILAKTKVAVIP